MLPLAEKNMVVIGDSRGVARRIVEAAGAMARACLRMAAPPASSDVADAVIELAAHPDQSKGKAFVVSGKGLSGQAMRGLE